MTWQKCTAAGSCTSQSGKVVIDSNWRWVHDKTAGSTTNCYTGNTWNTTLCPSDATCAANCALEGADYAATYGATAGGNSLKLTFVTVGTYATNIGSRLYLMDTDTSYQQFNLLNNEFTFDVDVSNLPCVSHAYLLASTKLTAGFQGLNGALYFVSMDKDGGMAKYSTNKAGAKYGVGYCDSQCPRDLKFIDGQVRLKFHYLNLPFEPLLQKYVALPRINVDGRLHDDLSCRAQSFQHSQVDCTIKLLTSY